MMHLFLHVVTGDGRVVDPEGEEFSSQAEASRAAIESARDLLIDALRSGKPLPLHWRIEVADAAGNVEATIPFATAAFAPEHCATSTSYPLAMHRAAVGSRPLE